MAFRLTDGKEPVEERERESGMVNLCWRVNDMEE